MYSNKGNPDELQFPLLFRYGTKQVELKADICQLKNVTIEINILDINIEKFLNICLEVT